MNRLIISLALIIGSIFLFDGCTSVNDVNRFNIFSVVNIGDEPIYVEITAKNINNLRKSIHESFSLKPYQHWGWWDESYDGNNDMTHIVPSGEESSIGAFVKNYPKIKFVIMACDENRACDPDRVLDVIEMTQEQFYHLHRCLYYPMPEEDKEILEMY